MKAYAAFFDLDRTILRGSSGRLFVKFSYSNNLISHGELLYGLYISFLHRLGIVATERIIRKWVTKYADWPEKRINDLAVQFFNEALISNLRESIVGEIERHREKGAMTVILSASMSFICEPVRRHLRMDDILCSTLEVVRGFLTGRLSGRYCYGSEKLAQMLEYCRARGISPADCYYYADSYADIPVFNNIGNPVCVSPDRWVRRRAEKSGWPIIEK